MNERVFTTVSPSTRRLPPYSEESERAVLGSLLIESERVLTVCTDAELTADSFYVPAHRILFEHISALAGDATKVIDLTTVGQSLKDAGRLDQCGGYAFLEGLIDGTPTSAHAQYYAEIVKAKENLRKIITTSAEAIDSCYTETKAEEIITNISCKLTGITTKEIIQCDNDIIQAHKEAQRGNPNCIPTPYESLTRRTGGVRKKMVTILTGRSKSGKSMEKSVWCRYLAENGYPGVDFCFEDGWEISKKRAASIGKYSIAELDAGGRFVKVGDRFEWWPVDDAVIEMERHALAELARLPLFFHDKRLTVQQLRRVISEYKRKHKIQYAFVDGAKDMKRPSGKYNDCGFEEEVSQAMTEIAQEFDIALIAIHHLTKISDAELITQNNIRGSGNIVADARAVYALQGDRNGAGLDKYSDFEYLTRDEQGYVTTRVLECIVTNHGQSGKVWLETDFAKCELVKR